MPVQRGGEAFFIFIPIVFVGWCFAATYVFYFPYYIVRYKEWDIMTKVGLGVFLAIIITFCGGVGYLLYLSSIRS